MKAGLTSTLFSREREGDCKGGGEIGRDREVLNVEEKGELEDEGPLPLDFWGEERRNKLDFVVLNVLAIAKTSEGGLGEEESEVVDKEPDAEVDLVIAWGTSSDVVLAFKVDTPLMEVGESGVPYALLGSSS